MLFLSYLSGVVMDEGVDVSIAEMVAGGKFEVGGGLPFPGPPVDVEWLTNGEDAVAWIRVLPNGLEKGVTFENRPKHCAGLVLRMAKAGWSFLCETDGVWYFKKRA